MVYHLSLYEVLLKSTYTQGFDDVLQLCQEGVIPINQMSDDHRGVSFDILKSDEEHLHHGQEVLHALHQDLEKLFHGATILLLHTKRMYT